MTMIRLLAQPAKQKQLKLIVSVFLAYGWLAALRRPGAHQRYADTWPTANARTQWQLWGKGEIPG
jgi:hypothetical protein